MTDKQINTCEFLNICQTDCNGTLEDTEMCHCYELYKQLARKEQKFRELNECSVGFAKKCQKLELNVCHLKDKNYNLQRQLDQLEAELEQEQTLKDMYFTYYKAKHSDIKGEFFKFKAENEKLKQTLTKIKEIARWHVTSTDSEDIQDDMKQILQLISEVKNEN